MKTTLNTTIFLIAAAASAYAQETGTTEAEATFRSAAAEAITPVTDRYITALASLARKLDRAGKTADARAVTTELERVREATDARKHPFDTLPGRSATPVESTGPSATTTAAPGAIFLTPDQARLDGSLKPHYLTRVLRGFFSEQDTATWTLENFTPGTYDLILDYSCPEDGQENAGGGTITVTAGGTRTEAAIEPLGTEKDFRRKVVGGITFSTPPAEISIRAKESDTPSGILRLRALILRPR